MIIEDVHGMYFPLRNPHLHGMRPVLPVLLLLALTRVGGAQPLPPYTPLMPGAGLPTPTAEAPGDPESVEALLDEARLALYASPDDVELRLRCAALGLAGDDPRGALEDLGEATAPALHLMEGLIRVALEPIEPDGLDGEEQLRRALRCFERAGEDPALRPSALYDRAWVWCELGRVGPADSLLASGADLEPAAREALIARTLGSGLGSYAAWHERFLRAEAAGDLERMRVLARAWPYWMVWMLHQRFADLAQDPNWEDVALEELRALAAPLDLVHPQAAAGIRERLDRSLALDPPSREELASILRDNAIGLDRLRARDHDLAFEISATLPDRARVLDLPITEALLQLTPAHALFYRGDLLAARRRVESARDALGDRVSLLVQSGLDGLLAQIGGRLGDREMQLEGIRAQLRLEEEFGLWQSWPHNNLALLEARLGNVDGALAAWRKAYAINRRTGAVANAVSQLENIAFFNLHSGRLDAALRYARAAQERVERALRAPQLPADRQHLRLVRALARVDEAEVLSHRGVDRPDLFRDAVDSAGGWGDAKAGMEARLARVRCLRRLGRPREAIEAAREAEAFPREGELADIRWRATALCAQATHELDGAVAALPIYERAMAMLEAQRRGVEEEDLLARMLRPADALLDGYLRACIEGDPGGASAYAVAERGLARALLDRVSPTGAPATAAAVRASLRPGEWLLQYWVGETESHAWLLGAEGVEHRTLAAGRAALSARVARWRENLRTEAPRTEAVALARLLLDPFAARIPEGDALILVPHGPLGHAPLGLLPVGGTRLLERNLLSWEASGSLHLALLREPGAAGGSLVVAGYEGGAELARRGLRPLVGAAEEARGIAALAGPSRLLLGDEASAEGVVAATRGEGLLHLACHAGFDPDGSPFLLLAPHGEHDGKVRPAELRDWPLDGVRLVTLSACETAIAHRDPERSPAGDLAGLSASVLAAGARGVVASLWKVDDGETRAFMRLFYEGLLQEGLSPARALRRAQRQQARDPSCTIGEGGWGAFCVYGPQS